MAYSPPPMVPGLPLLGNLLQYRRDHLEVFWRGYREIGPVFSVKLGPQRAAVLVGPENNRFFFTEADKSLSLPEVYRFVVPMFGSVLNAAEDEEVRRSHLALLHSAFQGGRMNRYAEAMARETSEWIADLGDEGQFELYDSFAALGMNIAATAFMGPEIRQRMEEFKPLYQDLAKGMDFVLPPNLPLPKFRRRDRARRALSEMIRPLIARRRAEPDRYDDFLQTIVNGQYLDGAGGSGEHSETVIGLTLMTVFTAYITTAAQTSWSLIQLLQQPRYLSEVLDEQRMNLGSDDQVSIEALSRLHLLDWALKETQRMHPVMSHYARYTRESYELGGHRVPQGWFTMICPAISHRLPEVFSDPDRYDPWRFSPGRDEDRHPYSLIGFGAGLYRCPGAGFGTNEMKCVLTMLLRRFKLELVDPCPGRDFEMGVMRPTPPCMVRYSKRQDRGDSVSASGRREARTDWGLCPVATYSHGSELPVQ